MSPVFTCNHTYNNMYDLFMSKQNESSTFNEIDYLDYSGLQRPFASFESSIGTVLYLGQPPPYIRLVTFALFVGQGDQLH